MDARAPGYELVAEHCAPDLTDRQRQIVRSGFPLLLALGWMRSPRPRSVRALVSEVVWPLGIGLWAGATARAIKGDADRRAAELAMSDAAQIEAAYATGRQRVVTYLADELTLAERDLDARNGTVDDRLLVEAARRLQEVRLHLVQLVDESGVRAMTIEEATSVSSGAPAIL